MDYKIGRELICKSFTASRPFANKNPLRDNLKKIKIM